MSAMVLCQVSVLSKALVCVLTNHLLHTSLLSQSLHMYKTIIGTRRYMFKSTADTQGLRYGTLITKLS